MAMTFGIGHPCGKAPERIAELMKQFVEKRSLAFEKCLVAKPTDWWRWTLSVATGFAPGAGTDVDIQVQWRCGTKLSSVNPIALPRLCGTDVHTHTGPTSSPPVWPNDCFGPGTTEQFEFEFVPGVPGPFVAADNPIVIADCTATGVKPVITFHFRSQDALDGALAAWLQC